jgi:transcriptional regulator with XRE-family HTH domain/energy-coupling factor transporter ATP-binding protein EcfA2
LALVREVAGLSIRDLAKKTGIPHSTLGGYFSGRHFPPLRILDQLDLLLDVCGVRDREQHDEWKKAFHRARRAHGPRSEDTSAPYRGLAGFEPEDARWFFGRDQLLDHLLTTVTAAGPDHLVMVVGPSGSGKSSLLRAGLLARLRNPTAGEVRWRTGLMTPGQNPTAALRTCLTELDSATEPDDEPVRSVIVVDQFEELFTHCHDDTERQAFLTAILDGPEGTVASRIVVCAMRTDFRAEALGHPTLASALRTSQITITPMDEDQVSATITEPAHVSGLELGDGLVPTLLRDLAPGTPRSGEAAHDPGTLPLLSHALLETWKRSNGDRLTVEDYEVTGGIQHLVATSAETVHTSLPEPARALARRLFLRLISVSEDSVDTRRRVGFDELDVGVHAPRRRTGPSAAEPVGPVVEDVVDRFVEARVLTTDADGVRISHDALLTAWPRLREWLDEDRDGLVQHRRLADAADGWDRADRSPDLLYRGGRLIDVEEWAADPDHVTWLNSRERDFLTAAVTAREAGMKAATRRTRRLKVLAAGLVLLAMAVSGISWHTWRPRGRALPEHDPAPVR